MKKKLLFSIAALAVSVAVCAGCGDGGFYPITPDHPGFLENDGYGEGGNFQYGSVIEQGFYSASSVPSSYFSLDRNTASYSQVRAQIAMRTKVAPDSVRTEELYNYFSYDYPAPQAGEEVRATAYLSPCPWNASNRLLTVGVKTEERIVTEATNNYVFLIDVSGSMSARVQGEDKMSCLDLVKHGVFTLLEGLGEHDSVSVVTYANGVRTRLEPTFATEEGKQSIRNIVGGLKASGATNGGDGLNVAYENAQKYYSEEGNNRVILMTDGDFNVGYRDEESLQRLIRQKAESGVYLSVLGFGLGNMRDDFMQSLALNGNGNYAYIDTRIEAEKVFSEELNGMLTTVAKDVKAGITFDAENVYKYRILGYDMKILSEDDFNDPEKDAGEIGSNLCVTAMYEVQFWDEIAADAKVADIAIRYQSAATGEYKEATASAYNRLTESDDLSFLSCVAEFGLILRDSQYRADAMLAAVISRLEDLNGYLAQDAYKDEFRDLVRSAKEQGCYGN